MALNKRHITDLLEETSSDYFTCLEEWSDEMKDGVRRKACWYNVMREKGWVAWGVLLPVFMRAG